MKARVLFGVFGFIFVLLALYVFPPIVLEAVVAALCVIATCEVLGSTKLVHNRLELLLAMLVSLGLAVGHFTVLPLDLTDVMQGLVLVMLVGSFAIELKFHDSMKVSQVAWGFFGALLVPYLLLSLLRIFQMNYHHGPFIVLLPLLAAWGADTCALFAGMFFGRHKLAPVVSPKKTVDGAVIAQLGLPDMRLPIQLALTWPERVPCKVPRMSLAEVAKLTFFAPDYEAFPALNLAKQAAALKGDRGAVLNGANEAAVGLFLDGRIGFTEIAERVSHALDSIPYRKDITLDDVLAADRAARELVLG